MKNIVQVILCLDKVNVPKRVSPRNHQKTGVVGRRVNVVHNHSIACDSVRAPVLNVRQIAAIAALANIFYLFGVRVVVAPGRDKVGRADKAIIVTIISVLTIFFVSDVLAGSSRIFTTTNAVVAVAIVIAVAVVIAISVVVAIAVVVAVVTTIFCRRSRCSVGHRSICIKDSVIIDGRVNRITTAV